MVNRTKSPTASRSARSSNTSAATPEQTGMAVALGDRVVRRAEWDDTTVSEGDSVEIVTAAQGG